MKALRKALLCSVTLGGTAAALVFPGAAMAQEGTEAANQDPAAGTEGQVRNPANEEIVVTGTLIRGIAPAGANVLATTDEDIEAIGANTVNQLFENIPQLGAFNSVQQPLAASPEVAVNRPNLRALPGFNTAGGSTTLVLVDGHRTVGMGLGSTTPDPDIIPPGIISRLEIVPDGGSAIYGSDAVAGVLNFVTIDRFDGVKVNGAYSFADDYYEWTANVTAGRDWGTGSLFASYAYAKNDEILGRDRDFIQQFPSDNGFRSLECSPGNIRALAGSLGAPQGTVVGVNGGPVNDCDTSDFAAVVPASERHSLFAGLSQDLSADLSVDIRGFYTNRQTEVAVGPLRDSRIIVPAFFAGTARSLGIPAFVSPFNPFSFGGIVGGRPTFVPASPNGVDYIQDVSFQIGPEDRAQTDIELDTWGLSSEFSYDLDGNFQVRFLGNYGQSTTTVVTDELNQTALNNAITAGLFNPFSPADSDPAALGIITNYNNFGRTRQQFTNFRAVIDGDLFKLASGWIKTAFGLEYYEETFDTIRGLTVPGAQFSGSGAQFVGNTLVAPAQPGVPRFGVSRDVKSAFGEIVAPLWRGDGGVELTVSASGRYDSYSDVGDTFNPRFGATFKPVDWIAIRGAWGKSFNAPSLADNENADIRRLFTLTGQGAAFLAPPTNLQASNGGPYPDYNGGVIVALRGNGPDIQPQKATTYTAGIDLDPPFIPGLRLSGTYYNISYTNYIGLAPFENPAQLYNEYGFIIDTTPTQAELDAFIGLADVFDGTPVDNPTRVYAILDARKRNFGGFKIDGLDFQVNYRRDMGGASVFFNSNGTYELSRNRQNVADGPFQDVLSNNQNRLRARTTLGAEAGPLLAQLSWNFKQGYTLNPPVGFVPQAEVGDFHTFDAFVKFDLASQGFGEELALTLNVKNIFDQDPPEYRGNIAVPGQQGVPFSYLTIGRVFQFGLSTKF